MIKIAFFLAAAAAAPADSSPRYLDCLTLVEADLELGRTAAQQWASEGGGADAQHCLAVADIAAGFPKLGAARLEDTAQRKDAGDDYVRARLLAQAAYAWLQGGEATFAHNAIEKAFALAPESGELHLTAAKVYAAQEKWQRVASSVTAAEDAGFVSSSSFVLRGRALTELGDYQAAAQDVVSALSIDPKNVEALVLRGELQQTGVVIEVYVGNGNSVP
ncbi:MAG: hypothetical protein AAF936_04205 [Pseudomonadota bacterium]